MAGTFGTIIGIVEAYTNSIKLRYFGKLEKKSKFCCTFVCEIKKEHFLAQSRSAFSLPNYLERVIDACSKKRRLPFFVPKQGK
jgi:hypothetical protein